MGELGVLTGMSVLGWDWKAKTPFGCIMAIRSAGIYRGAIRVGV